MKSVDEVEQVMATLLTNSKIQRASHNIMAYRVAVPAKGTFLQVTQPYIIPWLFRRVTQQSLSRAQHTGMPEQQG